MISSQPSFLTLKEAARRLGVHTATLRRWANNGTVAVILTPGGHRRFPETEIDRMVSKGGQRSVPAPPPSNQWMHQALTATRAEIAEHQDEHWLADLKKEDREEKRVLGKRLMGLMLQYLALEADAAVEGEDVLTEARAIGRLYGQSAHHSGLALADTLQATLFFRDHLVESALLVPPSTPRKPEAKKKLLRQINAFLNAIQIAIVDAYASAHN